MQSISTSVMLTAAFAAEPGLEGFRLALFSGGDERVFVDAATGRTRYGTPQGCAEAEVWFSSCTASALSPRGEAAAAEVWQALVAGRLSFEDCCDDIRLRLTKLFGVDGTQAVLAGSGTEATLLSTMLLQCLCSPKITLLIVGGGETGRGVTAAASGRHFLHHAAFGEVEAGTPLAGLDHPDISVETIEIRDGDGRLRDGEAVDAELLQKLEAARRDGRDVIVHSLDISKTGQSAPSPDMLAHIAARDRVFVLADCCQLRCSAEHIKARLNQGALVSLTGSKFAGGPSFCGALLIPPTIVQRLRSVPLPQGLAAYSAQCDWPAALRALLPLGFLPAANMGLALRWQAALAEIEAFFALPALLRHHIMLRFYEEIVRQVALTDGLELLAPCAASANSFGHTILSIAMRHTDGSYYDMREASAVQRRLREAKGLNLASQNFHLGQPVEIGKAGLLRLCASAATITECARGRAAGILTAEAFTPMAATIAELFRVWPSALEDKSQ